MNTQTFVAEYLVCSVRTDGILMQLCEGSAVYYVHVIHGRWC